MWPCDNVRREWRALTPEQQQSYIDAVNTLAASGSYTSWLNTHIDMSMDVYAHNSDGFFPWHRWYVWNFENQLRALGPQYSCLSIPYWDWSVDSGTYGQRMELAPAYVAFGGAGRGQCVQQMPDATGRIPFSAFSTLNLPPDRYGRYRGGCVSRQHRLTQRIPGPVELLDILTRNNQYGVDPRFRVGFRNAAIGPHNAVHNMIGGNMGTVYSCFDPIFMYAVLSVLFLLYNFFSLVGVVCMIHM